MWDWANNRTNKQKIFSVLKFFVIYEGQYVYLYVFS